MTNGDRPLVRNPRLLNRVVYLTLIILVGIGLMILPEATTKAAALALCVAFGLVYGFESRIAATPRRLAVYFAAQMIIILSLMRLSYPSDAFNFLFYILSLQAVLILPGRTAVAWLVGFYLVDSLSAVWSRGPMGVINVLFYAAAFMVTGVFGYALRQAEIARQHNQKLLEELRATQSQLQDLAVAEERNRLAREMHDSLGHRLTVAVVQLEGAQRLIPTAPDRAARMIGAMREEMKEALAELRRTVTALRTPLEAAEGAPLNTALTRLAQSFQDHTGLTVHCDLSDSLPPLPEAHRLALYRAAQESLTNTQRHASAKQVWLALSAAQGHVTLTAADDGKGFGEHAETSGGNYGLRGLRERAAQLGGELILEDRQGGGAQVRFSLPWREAPHA